ncbi:MAG: SMC-Scp complex subunit ScpB [Holophagales bacterium]|jgi:segregation and condensation protein B|nr:SMC-Scp complex subunit ScpB [Holophagales bacterium]
MTEERDETRTEASADGSAAEAVLPVGEAPEALPEPPPVSAPEDPLAETLPLVEALLFAASKPIPLEKLAEAAEVTEAVIETALEALEAACAADGRGVRLDRVAGGVRLVTRPEYDYPVRRLLGLDGKTKLSMAALETLAIVAYRQPVTGPEVAELRGVNSSSSIRTLLDRKLITTAGRKEVVGTPFLYKTTKEFLVHFGLKGLGDLPKPEELEAIYGLDAPRTDPSQTELFRVDEATGEVEVEIESDAPPTAVAGPDESTSGTVPAGETGEPDDGPAAIAPGAATEEAPEDISVNENDAAPAAAPEEERHDG